MVANANAPSLSIFRNGLRELGGSQNFVSVKLVGGNDTNQVSSEYSNRDAIGARITVTVAGKPLVQQLSAGEGFGAQNQAERRFGLGEQDTIDSIEVSWPSGKTQTITEAIASHSLVTIFEKPNVDQQEYAVAPLEQFELTAGDVPAQTLKLKGVEVPDGKMAVVTSMATWCPTCKSKLPELSRLKKHFSGSLDFMAVAIDEKDSKEKLQEYFQANQPPYELLPEAQENAVRFNEFVFSQLGSAKLSSTVILGPKSKVLRVLPRAPTISDIEMLIQGDR